MRKITTKICTVLAFLLIAVNLISCGNGGNGGGNDKDVIVRVDDERNLNAFDYTIANVAAVDALGRTVRIGDNKKDKDVGVFYHVWHGHHTSGIYDITNLLDENPDALYNIFESELEHQQASPLEEFHYWGEPLYGYYCSDDPWVITRHAEMLTLAGVDYLLLDLTNSVIYYDAINALFERLEVFHEQGFDVPKVAFYTNTGSRGVINSVYNTWYKLGLYEELWYKIDGKPLIVGVTGQFTQSEYELYSEFFTLKESQWPYGLDKDTENGFPWMEWQYPQTNYSGVMSVSLAQHPGARMSEMARSNQGRGFDFKKFRNYSANTPQGTNYAGQWETVLSLGDQVNNVHITGFNEWIAIKYEDGQSIYFVDTFNEEYSRDIEMMRGGYADNYYLQTVDFVKQFKYTEARHYNYPTNTINIADFSANAWDGAVAHFKDFAGDAMERNFKNAARTGSPGATIYTDNSNRNDFTDIAITHDGQYLYFRVQTLSDITAYNGTDENWMNLFISTGGENNFGGFDYVINRTPSANGTTSIEKSLGGYKFADAGTANYAIEGNVMHIRVPLSALGLSGDNYNVVFKLADNVTDYKNIEDYYVTGDSAPIGRLGYSYGY